MRLIAFAVIALTVAMSTVPRAHAATETVLYAFKGVSDGGSPQAALIADSAGNLYGTTEGGGAMTACAGGCGVVFELTREKSLGKWTETVLYAFKGGKDGQAPMARLVFDANGALYGTTTSGGGSSNCPGGCGTAFRLTPPAAKGKPWTNTVLHAFTGSVHGDTPSSGLVFGANGALYGTTISRISGVQPTCLTGPCGTVFKLTPPAAGGKNWTETGPDFTGVYAPGGGLLVDKSGSLYGTSYAGGSDHCFIVGCGEVFKLTPPPAGTAGWTSSVIYAFTGGPSMGGKKDGAFPNSDLIADSHGALYGTTALGPDQTCSGNGCGTVFKLELPNRAGAPAVESVLYGFRSATDGASPVTGRLAIGAGGALYGTTPAGGGAPNCNLCGTVFKLVPSAIPGARWTETVIHAFQGGKDGSLPQGGLIRISDALYGTTSKGGLYGSGTVYKVTP
jgi:hypothetical protein